MIQGTVHGRLPSPRALLWGWDDDPDTLERLQKLFPTWAVISDLDQVRQAEYDVVIANGVSTARVTTELFVVAFDGGNFGACHVVVPGWSWAEGHASVRRSMPTIAREFVIPGGLPDNLRQLVRLQLLPWAESQDQNASLDVIGIGTQHGLDVIAFRPFLATTEPRMLAGSFRRAADRAECWAFPFSVSDPVPWVAAALAEWQEVDPERFPVSPGWEHGAAWTTAAEDRALQAVEEARFRHEHLLQEAEKAIGEAEAALAEARAEGDAGRRRLLVAQGGDLVAAVVQALELLGFEVQDMDELWPTGDKREDLRVRDPGRSGWEAIVEVRGYTKGAQLNDLMRISARFAPRYSQDEGRFPHGAWYVVNHFITQEPTNRPGVLASNAAEVAEFANGMAPGLVINTVDLFKLCQDVERGAVTATDARRALVGSTGLFVPPVADTD